ncbi:MAG: PAS domain S-box-containing protein [Cellvibrionaceae bacterium]|jgi:PAS domain S-box-containing protein
MTTQKTNTNQSISQALSNALMQAAFTAVGEAIITINSESIIVMVNPEIENVFGYEVDELLGQPLEIIIPEKYRARHIAGMQNYLSSGVSSVFGERLELEGLRKSGDIFPLELRIVPIWVENQRFFTATTRDISRRKKQEAIVQKQGLQLEDKNHQLTRAHHFFMFTLESMELTLNRGGNNAELLDYIAQVKAEFSVLNKKKPKTH